jgi:hypothetical protein
METAYQPELWRDLYVMLGATAGALIGLLFIVTSLHLDDIVNNPVYRIRARNNSFYLLTLVIEAALILTPQSMPVLGAELTIIGLFMLTLHLRNIYSFYLRDKATGHRGGFSIFGALRFVASNLLATIAGLCLMAGWHGGLYVITASYLLFLVSITMNAWAIMLGVGEQKAAAPAS